MKTKRLLIIGFIIILVLAILNLGLSYLLRKAVPGAEQGPNASITPFTYALITPGQVNLSQLQSDPNYRAQKQKGEFQVFEYQTNDRYIRDEVLVKNNQVEMTKTALIDTSGNYAPIQSYFKNFGEPENTFFDKTYSSQVYAWPSKGFAVAGSREINQAFRTYQFTPTTFDKFKDEFSTEFEFENDVHSEGLGYP